MAVQKNIPLLRTLGSSANVGIGISAPTEKLEVAGNIKASGSITAGALNVSRQTQMDSLRVASKMKIGNSIVIAGFANNEIYTDNTPPTDLLIQSKSGYNHNTIINANNNGTVGIGVITTTNSPKLVVQGGDHTSSGAALQVVNDDVVTKNSLLYIRDDGNVGTGTNTPAKSLHIVTKNPQNLAVLPDVNSEVHLQQQGIRLEGPPMVNAVTPVWDIQPVSTSNQSRLGIGTPANGRVMTLTEPGNVGIGTASNIVGKLTINSLSADGAGAYSNGLVFTNNISGVGPWTHASIWSDGSAGYNGSLVFGTDGDDINNSAGISEKMRIRANGNVGIGTPAPEKKLHIVTTHIVCNNCAPETHQGIRLEDRIYDPDLIPPPPATINAWDVQPFGTAAFAIRKPGQNPAMTILNNGNVGIGTNAPDAILHVASNQNVNISFEVSSLSTSATPNIPDFAVYNSNQGPNNNNLGIVSIGVDPTNFKSVLNPITNTYNKYRLYVADGILTEHCRVALQSGAEWGDWVFDKDNKRMTFEEQWEYYTQKKHLKGIPSGSELKKSGIDITEMFTGVVINLEEVRLDAIQLHKENQKQKDEINELKKQVGKQQKEIQDLKSEFEKFKGK